MNQGIEATKVLQGLLHPSGCRRRILSLVRHKLDAVGASHSWIKSRSDQPIWIAHPQAQAVAIIQGAFSNRTTDATRGSADQNCAHNPWRVGPLKTPQPGDGANDSRIRAAFTGWNLSWRGLMNNAQGEWWLVGQLVLILAVILLPAWPAAWSDLPPLQLRWVCLAIGWSLLGGGALLASQALITLGVNLSPLPEPKAGIDLVSNGPYRLCRHPLYLAVLICATGVMLIRLSALHGILLVALAFVLRGKATREERRLLQRHPSYAQVFADTAGIAPGVPGLNWRVRE